MAAASKPLTYPIIGYQPAKALYALLAVGWGIVTLPLYIILYLIPAFRPVRQWSLLQAISNRIVRSYIYHCGMMKAYTPFSLKPGWESKRWEIVHPSRKDVYKGVLTGPDVTVKPEITGGTWYGQQPKDGKLPSSVILHFHGGAFVIGEPRDIYAGYAGKTLSTYVAPAVFMGGYRLASNPGGEFPAALQDVVTHYQHMLDLGFKPEQIIIGGDSAGGNLAINLIRYIEDNPGVLPLPQAALLWSPWLDLSSGLKSTYIASTPHYLTDYIPSNFPHWGVTNYAGDRDTAGPYISPALNGFKTSVPMFVQCGSQELPYDDALKFVYQMRTLGNDIELEITDYASHDIILVANLTMWRKQAVAAAKLAGKFLQRVKAEKSK